MPFAISTSWNASFHTSGKDLVKELSRFGFSRLELSFNLTPQMVEEIALLQKEEKVEILSVHNYCPIPDGLERKVALPDCYSMTALDNKEREKAIFFSRRSIDTAARLGAKAVVFHTGKVGIQDKTRILIRLYNEGKKDSKEYATIMQLMIKERKAEAVGNLEKLMESLAVLAKYAEDKGVLLGIENRYYFREIPSLDEFEVIFDKFKNVYYWHDVGHAQLYENLGFLKHLDYLKKYHTRLIGMHFHDIRGAEDHLPPLKGDFDFKLLLPFVKPETIKVIEAHYPATSEEVKKAEEYLTGLFR
ncbi:MAG: sugar phosphate isomerase/epimerase [Candidatus Omnitrophota bacterium]|nr:sugar phosphate isomerase/epimerase [Candidatus Omnitrophota bacterium]